MNLSKYQPVIGLEVHAQLNTASKLFCADATQFGASPNTQVSYISLAHPGTLPVINREAIAMAVKLGVALDCTINRTHYFARKNYFYPDLPKGYQISQHTAPICLGGHLTIHTAAGSKAVALNRIHMEEDAGKSLHDQSETKTCIDLNRAGMPLLEIVTEPVLHSAEEAFAYVTALRKLLRWLGVCDGNMEEGSLRCDANISIRLQGETILNTRVEVKNLNSIRNVKRAIEVEVARLISLTENGETVLQQTRGYNANDNTTYPMRTKEDADDYRYFPEPDLPLFTLSEAYISEIKAALPALPEAVKLKFQQQYTLSEYDADLLTADKDDAAFYERIVQYSNQYKAVANWVNGPLRNYCNENNCSWQNFPIPAASIAALVDLAASGKLPFNVASTQLLSALLKAPNESPATLAETLNLLHSNDDDALQQWIQEVLAANPEKVREYQSGKKNLLGLFAGEVKKKSKGKADMQLVSKLLMQALSGGK